MNVTLFTPHSGQQSIIESFADSAHKFGVVATGRQFGKSLLAQNLMLYWLLQNPGSKGAWLAPIYNQCKLQFNLLTNASYEIINKQNKSDLTIEFVNGSTLQFLSTDNYNTIRGFSFNYMVVVAELVVRNEAKAAKALAAKGIKTKPKRYEYQGTGYSDRQLDAAFRASPEEGSVAAMAKRMAAENPEKVAKKAAERARVTMARNRAETVERTAKKKSLTRSTPKVKRASTKKPTRPGSAEEAALVAKRVRPPAGYSGAKKVKPIKRTTKPVDTSVKITKPATKKTAQEIKDAKEAARQRRMKANARGKITGKDSVTKAPGKSKKTELKERPRTQEEMRRKRNAQEDMRKKDYRNKGRAERQRDVDDQEVPQGQTIRGKFYPEGTVGIPARSTRTGNTIAERSPKVREDLPPKDELTAIKKAFAELTKEEKEAMQIADARGIQGILREKILKGANKKPAGPKDAPTRKYVPPSRKIETAKARIRLQRKQQLEKSKKEAEELNRRLIKARRKLTPAQRKAVAEAIAKVRRNSR